MIISASSKSELKKFLTKRRIIDMKDDFVQQSVFTWQDYEEIAESLLDGSEKDKLKVFIEKVYKRIDNGSTQCLINCLRRLQNDKSFPEVPKFLDKLNKEDQTQTRGSAVAIKQEGTQTINQTSEKPVESWMMKFKICLEDGSEMQLYETLEKSVLNREPDFLHGTRSSIKKTAPGCLEIYLRSVDGNIRRKLLTSFTDGTLHNILSKIMNDKEMKKLLPPGKYTLETRIVTFDQSDHLTVQSCDDELKAMQDNIIEANRKFLKKQLDAQTFFRALSSKQIDEKILKRFENTLSNQSGCEKQAGIFLDIIQEQHLEVVFLEVLKEENMLYIYNRLETFRRVYSADFSSLRMNLVRNFSNLSKIDVDVVKDVFVERNMFKSLFQRIEDNVLEGTDLGMATLLTEIIKFGPVAMLTFVYALYICKMKELADLLLKQSENVGEQNQEEGEIVDNSSDQRTAGEECLFEGIYELIVRETDNEEQCSILTPTDLSLTATLSGEMYTPETVSHDKDTRMKLPRAPSKIEELQQSTENMKSSVTGDNFVRPKIVFSYSTPQTEWHEQKFGGFRSIHPDNMALLSLKRNENQKRYQILVVLLEDFERSLLEWIDDTNRVIKELRKLAKDLNEHSHNINIATASGSGGMIAGSILMAVGFVLAPFTFGGSIGLTIAGTALAVAGSVTRIGSTVADKVLPGGKRKATDALLKKQALSTQVVKDKCIDIGLTLQNLGKIEECFPEWVEFWAKVVGLSTKRNDRKWNIVTDKMKAEFDASAATLKVGFTTYGKHGVGRHTRSILVSLQIYFDLALDIYKKTPDRVLADISSLSDILEKQCPTVNDSSEMIKKIQCDYNILLNI